MGKAYEGISRLKVMDGHRAQGMTMAEGERGWEIKVSERNLVHFLFFSFKITLSGERTKMAA